MRERSSWKNQAVVKKRGLIANLSRFLFLLPFAYLVATGAVEVQRRALAILVEFC